MELGERLCEYCGQPMQRRRREWVVDWQKRRFCSTSCRAKNAARKDDVYEDLAWLLEHGTPIYDALRRCGIPTAEAAYQWAIRHDALALARRLKPAYNTEIAARHKQQRAQRKEMA